MKIMVLLFTALSLATAQSARVIPIEAKDAENVKTLQALVVRAQKDYDKAVERIGNKYTTVTDTDPDRGSTWRSESTSLASAGTALTFMTTFDNPTGPCYASYESVACLQERLADARKKEAAGKKPEPTPHYRWYRSGWENGFEFTKDFRFIVPKPAPVIQNPGYSWGSLLPLSTH